MGRWRKQLQSIRPRRRQRLNNPSPSVASASTDRRWLPQRDSPRYMAIAGIFRRLVEGRHRYGVLVSQCRVIPDPLHQSRDRGSRPARRGDRSGQRRGDWQTHRAGAGAGHVQTGRTRLRDGWRGPQRRDRESAGRDRPRPIRHVQLEGLRPLRGRRAGAAASVGRRIHAAGARRRCRRQRRHSALRSDAGRGRHRRFQDSGR